MKEIHIIGGGTVSHVRNHLALTAPAYGNTARELHSRLSDYYKTHHVQLHLTKMANSGIGDLETNEDVSKLVDTLIDNPDVKIIFFNAALVDYNGTIVDFSSNIAGLNSPSGKYEPRLKTLYGNRRLSLIPSDKIIAKIRKERKDIFLVGFKTTCGATEDEQFLTGLNLLKSSSCNLVLANDTKTRMNMVITPEQARYSVTADRHSALRELVHMALARAKGTFTRSTVVDGNPVPWNSSQIPQTLRTVVDYCIRRGAYPTFNGSSCGHFAYKKDANTLYTSIRKTNYNELNKIGLVKVVHEGDNKVIAHGFKPSVGACSQKIIYNNHPEMDCITHFHFAPKDKSKLSVRLQKWNECGSTECGKNTSDGLKIEKDGVKCVYLDNHGPNIVFNSSIDPLKVIKFIDEHFDFTKCTDGIKHDITNM